MKKERIGVAAKALVFIFAAFLAAFDLNTANSDQWQMLARAFLAGKLFFLQTPSLLTDTVLWNGHYYWPLGPFPALLFVPLVALCDLLRIPLAQGFIQLTLIALLFWLVFRIARNYFSPNDSAWLAIAFTFASSFIWIAISPRYGYLPYIIADAMLFAGILEYLGKKRWWLIGVLISIAFATRMTAGLGILFFLGDIIFIGANSTKSLRETTREKLKQAIELLAPFITTAVLLGIYNYFRFGNFLQEGYTLANFMNPMLDQALAYGMFSIVHLPGNLYYFFVAAPLPVLQAGSSRIFTFPFFRADPFGMSVFFLSPYLLYLFTLSYKDKVSKLLIATSIIIALPVFTYFGGSITQLGYRFALDFLPFIYFLLIKNYGEQRGALPPLFKTLIAVAAVLDMYWVFTLILFH